MKACPKCNSTEKLGTLERMQGVSRVEEISDSGEITWTGDTDVLYDLSDTFGVICRECGWEYEGADWQAQLNEVTAP